MPAPIDVYGALQQFIADNISGVNGVWWHEEPENAATPYVVLEDKSFQDDQQFEGEIVSQGGFVVHCFMDDADAVRTIARSIQDLLNPINAHTNIATDNTFKFIEVTEQGFSFSIEPDPDVQGNRIYRYSIDYKVVIERSYVP